MSPFLQTLYTYTVLALAPAHGLAISSGFDGEWSELDREVEALAASLLAEGGGPGLFGRLQTAYLASNDPSGDLGGFGVADARLGIMGARNGYEYRLEVDFADDFADDWGTGSLGLLDAQASFALTETVMATLGRFQPRISSNGLLDEGSMAFLSHSIIGTALAARDEGLMFQGTLSEVAWALCVMNGLDGPGDEVLTSLRVSMDLTPNERNRSGRPTEGAYGRSEEVSALAAFAMVEDHGNPGSDLALAEFRAGSDTWSLAFDAADVGSAGFASLADNISGVLIQDTNPHSISLTLMVRETWELALRVQDLDLAGLRQNDLALSHYLSGHDVKWTLGVTQLESSTPDLDTELWGIALNVGF
jgi:hypothetical protein